MNGGLVSPLPTPLQAAFVASGALALAGRTRLRKIVLWLVLIAAVAAIALFCLGAVTLILPWGGWAVTAFAVLLVRGLIDLTEMLRSRREVSAAFSGYVGPQVLRAIESGQLKPDLGGESRMVCVLHAGIHGLTDSGVVLPADQLVQRVNRCFTAVSPAIQEAGGMIDKYFGDGLIAIFGAPYELDDPVRRALEAAQEMLLRVQALNRELMAEGIKPLLIGIGLHLGDVVVGHLGTADRHAYTAVGIAVDTAAAIEAFTTQFSCPVLVSLDVVKAMGRQAEFAGLGPHQVPGIGLIQLHGWKPTALDLSQAAIGAPDGGT